MEATLLLIGILVMLIEAMIESVKLLVAEFSWELAVAFALGFGGSILFGIDLFELLGVQLAFNGLLSTLLGSFILGLLLVRYSGTVNALLDFLKGLKPVK